MNDRRITQPTAQTHSYTWRLEIASPVWGPLAGRPILRAVGPFRPIGAAVPVRLAPQTATATEVAQAAREALDLPPHVHIDAQPNWLIHLEEA